MRKRFLLVFCIYIVSQIAVAQCKFSMTLSINGCSNSLDGRIAERTAEALFNHYMEQASMGFNSLQECNTARNIILSELDIKDGNCRIRVNVSPCSGCSSMNFNSADILAIGQGSSFYSTNGVNEIRDWSNDDMERLLALNPEYKITSPVELSMGDERTDLARNRARDNAFVLDTNKPFRSLNVGEDGLINTHSADLNITNTDWQLIRSTKKLPYHTVEEFAEGTTQQYTSILDNILNLANMPLSTFEYNLKQCAYDIEGWYNSESIRLANELDNAEKLHDIANFMLQYKGYLAITYINGMSDNPAAADNAAKKAFGKTRDELAYESIEKMEKDLFEKYGMSSEDIAKLKKVIDDENYVQNFVEKARGLKIDEIADKSVDWLVENLDPIATNKSIELFGKDYNTIGGATGQVADNSISFDRAIDMGVLLNNDYGLWAHSKEVKALSNYIQSIKNQQNLIKEVRDKETQKIGDLRTIVENNSQEIKSEVSKMSQRDKLNWANNANDILGRVNSRKAKDSYEIFPDRFRNMYIREGTFIEYRGE